jgi:hypothetical protein
MLAKTRQTGGPVTLIDDGTTFTLTNGIVTTKTNKSSVSLTTFQ